jgi:hypothetical protein
VRACECLFAPYTKRGLCIRQKNLEDSNAIFRNVFRVVVVEISSKRSNEQNVVGVLEYLLLLF